MVAIDRPPARRSPRDEKWMSLGAHFAELRRRLMIAAAAVVLGLVIAFIATDPVIYVLTEPIRAVSDVRGAGIAMLNFETVTSGFDLRLRISFAIGILVAAPVWLWQLWAFLMPGLSSQEIRYTLGFLAAAIPLFFAGCVAGLLIMPHIIEMMAMFVPAQGAQFYTASYYYDFILKLLIVVGISFVLPVFLVALNVAGIVSGRAILKSWRIAVLVAAVFAAIATPAADIVSMLLLWGALVVLFFAAALLSLLFDRRRRKRLAAGIGAS